MKIYKIILFNSALTLMIGTAGAQNNPETARPELTIKQIMQGKAFVGGWPGRIYWSENGKDIYFTWNPDNADADSLYVVSKSGGEPRRVTNDERPHLPSWGGDYNEARTKKVYTIDGDIYLHDIKRGQVRRISATVEDESNPQFTHDEKHISFTLDNNLYLWNLKTGVTTQITDFKKGKEEPDEKEPDNDNEKWIKKEELRLMQIIRERKEKSERAEKIREDRAPERPLEIFHGKKKVRNVQLSPDERFVTFRLSKEPKDTRRPIVPSYVTESGYTEDLKTRPNVGGPGTTYEFGIYDRDNDTVYYVEVDSLPGMFDTPAYLEEYKTEDSAGADSDSLNADSENDKTGAEKKKDKPKLRSVIYYGPYWSDDGSHAVLQIVALDSKDLWLAELDPETGKLTHLTRKHDDAWLGGPGIGGWFGSPGNVGWLADNKRIWFKSEETGFAHLYTLDVTTGEKTALTAGEFNVTNVSLSHDKKSWYFISNQVHPGEQHFYRMPLAGGQAAQITSMPGRSSVVVSPDEKSLAIRYSFSNKPWELYVMPNKPGAKAKQLTHSTTEEFEAYRWRVPEHITFSASDGANVHARLYRPENPQPNGPAVVFVHGAGHLQNAHKWWSSYYREYMFHNFLVDNGYTVFDIDYRASAGYGRDWRTAIYRHMGGKDLSDQVDGAKFLVDNYAVDSARIGIYGGSYGGFITFMAMFTEPGIFAAGAALRPVSDWAHYNHGYTSGILNIPQLDSIAFVRSSPIYHAEGLEGALLICHGMIDRNVLFQDVVRLTQRLIELGKDNWEVAMYPLEGHGFREPSSWTDEYSRIFKLFEENLK